MSLTNNAQVGGKTSNAVKKFLFPAERSRAEEGSLTVPEDVYSGTCDSDPVANKGNG